MKKMMTLSEIAEQFQDLIAKARKAIAESETKVAQFAQDYREATTAFALGGGKETANALSYARGAMTHEKTKLAEAKERLSILEQMRVEKLREAFPDLIEERKQAVAKMNEEYRLAAERLLRLRAETLIELARLGALAQETSSVHSRVVGVAQQIGVEYRTRFETPTLNLTSQYAGVDTNLIPTANEVTEALRLGKLPAFVRYYAQTGELIGENKASAKLREMTTKEAKK